MHGGGSTLGTLAQWIINVKRGVLVSSYLWCVFTTRCLCKQRSLVWDATSQMMFGYLFILRICLAVQILVFLLHHTAPRQAWESKSSTLCFCLYLWVSCKKQTGARITFCLSVQCVMFFLVFNGSVQGSISSVWCHCGALYSTFTVIFGIQDSAVLALCYYLLVWVWLVWLLLNSPKLSLFSTPLLSSYFTLQILKLVKKVIYC